MYFKNKKLYAPFKLTPQASMLSTALMLASPLAMAADYTVTLSADDGNTAGAARLRQQP